MHVSDLPVTVPLIPWSSVVAKEDNSRSAAQKISLHLWIIKSSLPFSQKTIILDQPNPVHILPSWIHKIRFNIILSPAALFLLNEEVR
jgi:hypothetical protein